MDGATRGFWTKLKSRRGQGLVEYALIIVLVAVVVMTGVLAVRGSLSGTMDEVFETIGEATE